MIPCAHYLVRMFDGRIDMQGTVADLQESNQLDYVVLDAEADTSSNSDPDAEWTGPSIDDAAWPGPALDAIDNGRNMIDSARDAMPSPEPSSPRAGSSPTRDGAVSPRDSLSSTRGSRPPTRQGVRAARQQTVFTGPSVPIKVKKGPRKLVQDEARAKGNVKWRIYKVYLQAS